MKKAVIFLTVLIIFVSLLSPVNIFADVNIGNDNENIVSENDIIIGQKLAILEVLQDIVAQGVSSFTLDNVSDVDEFVDYFWDELQNDDWDISELQNDPEWYQIITDFNSYKEEIEDSALNHALTIADKGYDLVTNGIDTLSEFFDWLDNETLLYKVNYVSHPSSIGALKALSKRNGNLPTPNPDPDFSFIQNINNFYVKRPASNGFPNTVSYYDTLHWYAYQGNGQTLIPSQSLTNYSYISDNFIPYHTYSETGTAQGIIYNFATPITINVTSQNDNTYSVVYSSFSKVDINNVFPNIRSTGIGQVRWSADASKQDIVISLDGVNTYVGGYIGVGGKSIDYTYNRDTFDDLSNCLNYIYQHYCNINLYVDNVPWALIYNPVNNAPLLDIDGLLKLQGQNQPVTYYYPSDIQIDYNKLYDIIVQAIEDGTPVSMETINNNQVYNDSHDTFYAPTINNVYNYKEDNEDLFIETILDLAAIPNFDVAYVQPINQPFLDGMTSVMDGVSAIPNDILLLFGALFVLFLFVLMMNRFFE